MKKLITIIALFAALTAQAQHSYISSSGNVYLVSGSTERYGSPDIYVDASYNSLLGTWVATLTIYATGATTNAVKAYQYEFTDAEIDAFTATGSTTTEKLKNCALQAVEGRLITETGSDIFTLH